MKRPPPLDAGLPLIGHLPEFVRARGPLLARLYRKHGPCFRMRLGPDTPVVMAGPELVELATKDAGRVLHAGPVHAKFVAEFGGYNCLLGADLEPHFHRRKQLMPVFTPRAVTSAVPRMIEIARDAVPGWSAAGRLDLVDALKRLTTRQAGMVLTGTSPAHLHDDICTFLDGAVAVALVGLLPPWALKLPRYANAKRRVLSFCESLLEERRTMPPETRRGDLVDLIIDALEPDGRPIPRGEREALVVLAFAAGLDTVAHTTAFLLYELLASPRLRQRCVAEADALFAEGTFDPSRLQGLATLAAAATETLRRHPMSDLSPRVAGDSFEFAGCHVEKGSRLMLGNTVSHSLPELFRDPERFDADRCLPPRNEHLQPGAFTAFGFGPHKCIGARLGEAQMLVTVATLLHFAELELDPPGYQLKVSTFPVLKPKGLRVRVRPRRARADRQPGTGTGAV
jgi:cytochrome P450